MEFSRARVDSVSFQTISWTVYQEKTLCPLFVCFRKFMTIRNIALSA